MKALFSSPFRPYVFIFLFFLISLALFEKGKEKKEFEFKRLENTYFSLLKKEQALLLEEETLLNEKQSQEDPSYQELLLMKHLGMAPKGHVKVVFYKDTSE